MKGSNANRELALSHVYQSNKDAVFSYILKNSGSLDEAKDVYQEAVIAFYENVRDNKFKGESSIGTYLYAIARFKWLNQIKKKNMRRDHHHKLEVEEFDDGPLATIIDIEKQRRVLEVLDELGTSCKKLLINCIYHNASMKEIVAQGDYSSEQIARNKKFKCLQKLRALIVTKPALLKILKEYD